MTDTKMIAGLLVMMGLTMAVSITTLVFLIVNTENEKRNKEFMISNDYLAVQIMLITDHVKGLDAKLDKIGNSILYEIPAAIDSANSNTVSRIIQSNRDNTELLNSSMIALKRKMDADSEEMREFLSNSFEELRLSQKAETDSIKQLLESTMLCNLYVKND